jgi:hypothetical protein
MPWLVTETVPWDGLVTAVVLFAVVFAVVSFAAVVGYVWECAQLRSSSIRKARRSAVEPTAANAS